MNTRLEDLLNIGGFVLATAGAVDMLAPRDEYNGNMSKYDVAVHSLKNDAAVHYLFHPKEEATHYARQIIPGAVGFLTGMGMVAVAGFASSMRKRKDVQESQHLMYSEPHQRIH